MNETRRLLMKPMLQTVLFTSVNIFWGNVLKKT